MCAAAHTSKPRHTIVPDIDVRSGQHFLEPGNYNTSFPELQYSNLKIQQWPFRVPNTIQNWKVTFLNSNNQLWIFRIKFPNSKTRNVTIHCKATIISHPLLSCFSIYDFFIDITLTALCELVFSHFHLEQQLWMSITLCLCMPVKLTICYPPHLSNSYMFPAFLVIWFSAQLKAALTECCGKNVIRFRVTAAVWINL
jgi:hypothetical protein